MKKEKCFSTCSQVEGLSSYTKDSLTFTNSEAGDTQEMQGRQKRVFSRVNLISLDSAGVILKRCMIKHQLQRVKRLMGSWNFRKVTGQSKQLDLSQTVWRWEMDRTWCHGRTHLGRRLCFQHCWKGFSLPCLSVWQRKRWFASCNWNAKGHWQYRVYLRFSAERADSF